MSQFHLDAKIYSDRDFPAYLPKLSQLYDDLFSDGKGFRARLVRIVGGAIELEKRVEQLLAQTIEFIHNASLLHDDLIDESVLRRGKTAAWKKYTPEYAVLAGDYLLARVMVNLSSHGNIKLVQYTAEMISDLLEGEWLQDSVVGDFFISMEQLDRIHNLKTASLFKWCLRAPFMAQGREEIAMHNHLNEMGNLLGQLFQRSDDLLDFDVRNFEGKALLGDLHSGYLNSFGAYLVRDRTPKQIDELVRSKTLDELYQHMGGRAYFDQCVNQFDQLNQNLIELYNHHLEAFSKFLKPNEQKLLVQLKKLPEPLYWRKKSS